jgi:hypothetical protein
LPHRSAQAIFAPNGAARTYHLDFPVALGDSKLLIFNKVIARFINQVQLFRRVYDNQGS